MDIHHDICMLYVVFFFSKSKIGVFLIVVTALLVLRLLFLTILWVLHTKRDNDKR